MRPPSTARPSQADPRPRSEHSPCSLLGGKCPQRTAQERPARNAPASAADPRVRRAAGCCFAAVGTGEARLCTRPDGAAGATAHAPPPKARKKRCSPRGAHRSSGWRRAPSLPETNRRHRGARAAARPGAHPPVRAAPAAAPAATIEATAPPAPPPPPPPPPPACRLPAKFPAADAARHAAPPAAHAGSSSCACCGADIRCVAAHISAKLQRSEAFTSSAARATSQPFSRAYGSVSSGSGAVSACGCGRGFQTRREEKKNPRVEKSSRFLQPARRMIAGGLWRGRKKPAGKRGWSGDLSAPRGL